MVHIASLIKDQNSKSANSTEFIQLLYYHTVEKSWAKCLWTRWLTPVILAIWETEIRRVTFQDQPHHQNNQSKKDWRCGSSNTMSALQM
jgi:hypothetical protein